MGRSGMTRAAIAVALVALLTTGGGLATHAVDYPSWDDVEAARGDAAATASTVASLEELLSALEAEAARLGDIAVARASEASIAQSELERATTAAASLALRAEAAQRRAENSAQQIAQVAAVLYRSGNGDLATTLLLGDAEATDGLLDRLGALDRVGEKVQLTLEQARTDANLADSLAAQADAAQAERDRIATEASTAAAAAQTAVAAADAAVAGQQARLETVYAQLAALRNTSVELEQQYRVGQQNAAGGSSSGGSSSGGSSSGGSSSGGSSSGGSSSGGSSSGGSSSGGSSSGGSSSGGFTVPGNDVNNVAAAREYAYGLLAAKGQGTNQQNCLLWLWNYESGWRTNAYNAGSGAYGIPQAVPGSKMATMGADWRTNYRTQVRWGLAYIEARYDTACGAWAHVQSTGWY